MNVIIPTSITSIYIYIVRIAYPLCCVPYFVHICDKKTTRLKTTFVRACARTHTHNHTRNETETPPDYAPDPDPIRGSQPRPRNNKLNQEKQRMNRNTGRTTNQPKKKRVCHKYCSTLMRAIALALSARYFSDVV